MQWETFSYPSIPLEGGRQYELTFLNGEGSSTCQSDYTAGEGLNHNFEVSNDDLAFRLVFRSPDPGELIWGCTDPLACNFNPDATHENGSCSSLDCNGDCGGDAYVIEGCGCVGGNSASAPQSCYGCMAPNACNFDENAAIEDQSCLYTVDCNGDCGGMAVLTNECGCVGGLTGVDANSCLGMCQGEICLSTYPSDPDGFANTSGLAFSQSGQTFTAVSSSFLTGTRVRNAVALTGSALTVELRRLDAPDIHNGTLLAVTSQANFTESPGQGFDIFLEWSSPVLLESGSEYALVFIGADWFILRAESSLILNGASFEADESTASQHDLFFELMCCDEVAGCAMPTACNFDAWATLDNGSCLFPLPDKLVP